LAIIFMLHVFAFRRRAKRAHWLAGRSGQRRRASGYGLPLRLSSLVIRIA